MRACSLVALVLSGCSQIFGLERPTHPADASVDVPVGPICLGSGDLKVCLDYTPTEAVQLSGSIATATCSITDRTHATPWCVVAGKSVTVSTTVVGRGPYPLVVFAVDTITVTTAGVIDVASHRAMTNGAGANDCASANGNFNSNGGGGGGGGSFGSSGGNGGTGASGTAPGGLAEPSTMVVSALRGGCAGGLGGGGAGMDNLGGPGGGALYLVAGAKISIAGTLNASGAGGAGGGGSRAGGGGGGSGGMIVLGAPMIDISGSAFANGGGGGGGADNGATGMSGADPSGALVAATGGRGGGSTSCGVGPGCGGDGGYRDAIAANGINDATGAGGGGGGGGTGVIRVVGVLSAFSGSISPSPKTE